MRRMIAVTAALAVLGALAAGCGRKDTDGVAWSAVAETALDPVQVGQREKALEARRVLFSKLSAHLESAMQDSGEAAAIRVCRREAPRITAEVSEEQGVRIGRTSFRLRNPADAPPGWAKPMVESREEETVYVAASDGRLGALYPIRTQAACTACHGRGDLLAPDVREALASLYPGDEATGFGVGDLRGWYWVEVSR